jgi:hypothetical protein
MDERKLNTLVGFGVELPDGTSIETAWGTLRARRSDDAERIRSHGAEYDPGRGCILEPPARDGWGVRPDGQRALFLRGIEDPNWKRVALGLLLAQDPLDARPTLPWFCVEYLEGGGGGAEFRQYRKGGDVLSDQLPEVKRWLDLLNNQRLSEVAVDRATQMVHRITDHVASLIDGVIVWESLFGPGSNQELSFRVSACMASVLSDDPAERVAYQKEIKKLYERRSGIVHGGPALKSGDDHGHRHRVQELTLSAMRALLARRPWLVGAKAQDFMAFVLGVRPPETDEPVEE